MRTRDEIMTQWDVTRRAIAGGCTNSGPRDWLEGVLDEREERIAELEAALQTIANANYDIGTFALWARDIARTALKK